MRECVVLEISLFNFGNSGGVSRLEEDGDQRGFTWWWSFVYLFSQIYFSYNHNKIDQVI